MPIAPSEFSAFLAQEVQKTKGICVPVKSSLLRRAIVIHASPLILHPNPEDEFCDPQIGPAQDVIAQYKEEILDSRQRSLFQSFQNPLIVERVRPDGYMILNGHHRWAAALITGLKLVPIQIVNLTQEYDIHKMLEKSIHNKRVTLDIDEVVFQNQPGEPAEKQIPFPLNRIYKERLHSGIPALFHYFMMHGYDIWVFSEKYYSTEYIQNLFRLYHVQVHGIITGTGRKKAGFTEAKARVQKLMAERYPVTLHVDLNMVVKINSKEKSYEEYSLQDSSPIWTKNVIDIFEQMEKQDHLAS